MIIINFKKQKIMMSITIQDVRRAISYVNMSGAHVDVLLGIDNEQLLAKDFAKDFGMGNIRFADVLIELERIHGVSIPMNIATMMKDNTVGSFLTAVNHYIKNFLRPDEMFKVNPN